MTSLASETISLADAAGRWLAEDVAAERDHPPFDRMTHDGIALGSARVAAGQREFAIESYAAAGDIRKQLRDAEKCIEAATGAPLPEGCDAVIPYEELTMADGRASLKPEAQAIAGRSVHRQGSDAAKGERLIAAGTRIGAVEMAILASNGVASVPVRRLPRIGILATGDELVGIDAAPKAHQIRRSNDVTLATALALSGFPGAEIAHAADDAEAIGAWLANWLVEKDIVLVIGGISRGRYDLVPGVLGALGAETVFHHVAQRPGKPMLFATCGDCLIFGLPGNPVSCLTCLRRYVVPALWKQQGETVPMRKVSLGEPLPAHATLTLFSPAVLGEAPGEVIPRATQGSGDFVGLSGSAGFMELPPRSKKYPAGTVADFYPWVAA